MKTKSTIDSLSRAVGPKQLSNAVSTGVQTTAHSTRWFIGFTRHGIVSAGQRVDTPTTRAGVRQVVSLFFGSAMIGLGVALFVRGDLGVPAYDVMLTAVSGRLGVSLGQAGWLFNGFLFVIAAVLGQRPRPIALVYIVANGIAVDTFLQLLRQPDSMVVRLVFVVLGTMSMASAVALVVHAGLGGGATELLMRAGETRGHNPYRLRTALEVTIVVVGIILGGSFGPATVFFVLTVSSILRMQQRALHDHRAGRQLRLAHQPHRESPKQRP